MTQIQPSRSPLLRTAAYLLLAYTATVSLTFLWSHFFNGVHFYDPILLDQLVLCLLSCCYFDRLRAQMQLPCLTVGAWFCGEDFPKGTDPESSVLPALTQNSKALLRRFLQRLPRLLGQALGFVAVGVPVLSICRFLFSVFFTVAVPAFFRNRFYTADPPLPLWRFFSLYCKDLSVHAVESTVCTYGLYLVCIALGGVALCVCLSTSAWTRLCWLCGGIVSFALVVSFLTDHAFVRPNGTGLLYQLCALFDTVLNSLPFILSLRFWLEALPQPLFHGVFQTKEERNEMFFTLAELFFTNDHTDGDE